MRFSAVALLSIIAATSHALPACQIKYLTTNQDQLHCVLDKVTKWECFSTALEGIRDAASISKVENHCTMEIITTVTVDALKDTCTKNGGVFVDVAGGPTTIPEGNCEPY
ncbi:hypothetical protein BG004_002538 [Podila humilis]|nr:hypothetical protein BG004_002538 [Podila humilis]